MTILVVVLLPWRVLVLDLDHFKDYNDSHGHQGGDQVLAGAAHAWRRNLGRHDILARYGGEEFGLLLPGVSLAGSVATLEGLRSVMPYGQTVSIGAAEVMTDEDPIDTFRRADVALYRAQAAGRDCLRLDPGSGSDEPDQVSPICLTREMCHPTELDALNQFRRRGPQQVHGHRAGHQRDAIGPRRIDEVGHARYDVVVHCPLERLATADDDVVREGFSDPGPLGIDLLPDSGGGHLADG